MSGNGYGYYYPPPVQSYPMDPNQAWSEWTLEQQQYMRNAASHNTSALSNHTNNPPSQYTTPPPSRPQSYYGANNRHYQQRSRYSNSSQPYNSSQPPSWQRSNYSKRSRLQDSPDGMEPKSKNAKKKKKPLSQNIPSKKDWTMEEAETALSVEKEYNKRYKNHSLIIKFPDLELNRDIVTKFHKSIESVHFQQPSTPRFCFVTLQESADADAVITSLNKIKFGDGYLTAEYKKDREEDQNIGPEDIDPCTLYVGNLAQEITKEDMVKTYPKGRRIDIGYAKKMKYTRYAFVSFKNVTDSIEAFKKTHSTQMYSKSLIVRFRRLHGTVGMPGESKPQSPAKNKGDQTGNEVTNKEKEDAERPPSCAISENSTHSEVDLSVVKQEVNSSDDEVTVKHPSKNHDSPFMAGSINVAFQQHKPMVKREIKEEVEENAGSLAFLDEIDDQGVYRGAKNQVPNGTNPQVKDEPKDVKTECQADDDAQDDLFGASGSLDDVNFSSLLNQLENHSNQIQSLRSAVP